MVHDMNDLHINEAIEAICLQIYIIFVHFFSVLVYFVVFWCNTLSLGKWKLDLGALPALQGLLYIYINEAFKTLVPKVRAYSGSAHC